MEKTLILLKPDALQRGLAGQIVTRFEAKGLKIVALKLLKMDRQLAERHYDVHRGKPFFEGLVEFITSGPIVAMVLEGRKAVEAVRKVMGATDSADAQPGTVRGDLGLDLGHNLIHGSDSPQTAQKEIALFFLPGEILSYHRAIDPWILEGK
ncbi:MAG: nucleoside-diphosphate kinase [bacterium]|nr:nucleoside-diphosphate kinase [bacterium]